VRGIPVNIENNAVGSFGSVDGVIRLLNGGPERAVTTRGGAGPIAWVCVRGISGYVDREFVLLRVGGCKCSTDGD